MALLARNLMETHEEVDYDSGNDCRVAKCKDMALLARNLMETHEEMDYDSGNDCRGLSNNQKKIAKDDCTAEGKCVNDDWKAQACKDCRFAKCKDMALLARNL